MRARLTAFVVTPAPPGSRHGNRITALRWAKRLRELGARVRIEQTWRDEPCDVLVALHARRSHPSIARHAEIHPTSPRVLALTGTDLYVPAGTDPLTQASMAVATRCVVLQPLALPSLPGTVRDRARVIRQSARAPAAPLRIAPESAFVVCVLAHLRDVKDPLLAARAARSLPGTSSVQVFHLGAALDDAWRAGARDASRVPNGRWTWLGDRPRVEALRVLAGADLLVLTSVQEGGANVVTEAIACGVPVLSTRIDGSLGILGADYPGYFDVGDASGLADLLERCEREPSFLSDLRARCDALRPLVDPAAERESWRSLLDELGLGAGS